MSSSNGQSWLKKMGHYPGRTLLGCAACGAGWEAIRDGLQCPLTPEMKFKSVEVDERAEARAQGRNVDEWLEHVKRECGVNDRI